MPLFRSRNLISPDPSHARSQRHPQRPSHQVQRRTPPRDGDLARQGALFHGVARSLGNRRRRGQARRCALSRAVIGWSDRLLAFLDSSPANESAARIHHPNHERPITAPVAATGVVSQFAGFHDLSSGCPHPETIIRVRAPGLHPDPGPVEAHENQIEALPCGSLHGLPRSRSSSSFSFSSSPKEGPEKT